MIFKLRPLQNITCHEQDGHWSVEKTPALLELQTDSEPPSGWVLLRGHLVRRGSDFSASLIAVTGTGRHVFPLPVSRKGTLLEMVCLPEGVERLILEPMNSVGEFELTDFSLRPVGVLERVSRMYRRVLPIFFKQPRTKRQKAELRLHLLLSDLVRAYRIAGLFRAYSPEISYAQWIREFDQLHLRDRRSIRKRVKRFGQAPAFQLVVVPQRGDREAVARTLASLREQLYRNFSVTCLADGTSELFEELSSSECRTTSLEEVNGGLSATSSPLNWLIVMPAGTVLAEHALFWLASEAQKREVGLIYADHDSVNADGKRFAPIFKPDWSPELFRSTHYLGSAVALRTDLCAAAGGLHLAGTLEESGHDLCLRVVERLAADAIRHIPAVLFHLPEQQHDPGEILGERGLSLVADHLQRLGVEARVESASPGAYRIRYALPDPLPLISIVIPTRDALAHFRSCVESILTKSSYPNFEILVVDNQSAEPATRTYLDELGADPRVRVLDYPQPFNYSAINNLAAQHAQGEVLCLLNNDTEVISEDWLEEMLGHLLQADVGVVGAKLYYGDGRVQHAGDTVGPGGCADHLHSRIARDDPGYCRRAVLAQDLSAVTAACLLTWKSLYGRLGGLDENNLPVSFNDVDYCLRVREAGRRVVWTPHAELYHHESVSRSENPEFVNRMRKEANYMRQRWKHVMSHDPFYNPNLSYERPDFSLSHAPMVQKPWM